MLVIYLIAQRGRVRYEASVKKFASGITGADGPTPLLSSRSFWSVSRISATTEMLHFSAAVSLVLFLLCWDAAFSALAGCGAGGFTRTDCFQVAWDEGFNGKFALIGVGVAAVLLIMSALFVWTSSVTFARRERGVGRADRRATPLKASNTDVIPKRATAIAMLVVTVVAYTAFVVYALFPENAKTADAAADAATAVATNAPFLGLVATPVVLIVVALGLAFAGLGWGRGSSRVASAVLLSTALLAVVASHLVPVFPLADGWKEILAWVLLVFAVLLVIAHLIVVWGTRFSDSRVHAWRGQAAGVVMLLALFASMAIASLLVLGVGGWLNTSTTPKLESGIWRTPSTELLPLDIPNAYERFAVVLSIIAILTLLVVVLSLVPQGWGPAKFSLPRLANDATASDDDRYMLGTVAPDRKYPEREKDVTGQERRVVRARLMAALLQRGEPLFGWLAAFTALGFVALGSAAFYDVIRESLAGVDRELPPAIRAAATTILFAVAVAAVAAVATHAASSTERPFGLFWDVVCFFPRAGHPFGPPCYGERTVPELKARTLAWLGAGTIRKPRHVVLSAHSMGAVLVVATIFALRDETFEVGPRLARRTVNASDRVALLSYGVQLRAYFSRFFPAVLGADVLGVRGTTGPSLWRADPWTKQVRAEWPVPPVQPLPQLPPPAPGPPGARPSTLAGLLGSDGTEVPRWRSLWRRTDFLGFPVCSYNRDNPIDRGAAERAPGSYLWSVATHNDYLDTAQYSTVRDELVRALRSGRPTSSG